MTSAIDVTKPATGAQLLSVDVRNNFVVASSEITTLQSSTGAADSLALATGLTRAQVASSVLGKTFPISSIANTPTFTVTDTLHGGSNTGITIVNNAPATGNGSDLFGWIQLSVTNLTFAVDAQLALGFPTALPGTKQTLLNLVFRSSNNTIGFLTTNAQVDKKTFNMGTYAFPAIGTYYLVYTLYCSA